MPRIEDLTITSPQATQIRATFAATVSAEVHFSEVEKQIGLTYQARILLFEANGQTDLLSLFPNGHGLHFQQMARDSKDDFLGFSPAFGLQAQADTASISHTFDAIRSKLEPDGQMDLRALVVCVPSTATAMKWSAVKHVPVLV